MVGVGGTRDVAQHHREPRADFFFVRPQNGGQRALWVMLLLSDAGVPVAVAGRATKYFPREVVLAVGMQLVTDVLEL